MIQARPDAAPAESTSSKLTFKNHANPLFTRPGLNSARAHEAEEEKRGSVSIDNAAATGAEPLMRRTSDDELRRNVVGYRGGNVAGSAFGANGDRGGGLGLGARFRPSASSPALASMGMSAVAGDARQDLGRNTKGSAATAIADAAGGHATDRHSVLSPDVASAPEWDPYEDDSEHEDHHHDGGSKMGPAHVDEEMGIGDGQVRGRGPRRGRPGRGSVIGPGAITMGSMSEARVRFLTAVKAHCTERYRQGWLSSTGLRVLKVRRRCKGRRQVSV